MKLWNASAATRFGFVALMPVERNSQIRCLCWMLDTSATPNTVLPFAWFLEERLHLSCCVGDT